MNHYGKIFYRSLALCTFLMFFASCYERYPYYIQVPEYEVNTPSDGSEGILLTIFTVDEKQYIRYTTDGSTPTETDGTLYENPVSLFSATFVQAVAYREGYPAGPVSEYYYDPQNN